MRTTECEPQQKAIARSYWFESDSSPNRPPYETLVWSDGTVTCNCKGWTRQVIRTASGIQRSCKHTRLVLSKQAERYAIKSVVHADVRIDVSPTAPKTDERGAERLFDFTA